MSGPILSVVPGSGHPPAAHARALVPRAGKGKEGAAQEERGREEGSGPPPTQQIPTAPAAVDLDLDDSVGEDPTPTLSAGSPIRRVHLGKKGEGEMAFIHLYPSRLKWWYTQTPTRNARCPPGGTRRGSQSSCVRHCHWRGRRAHV
eukprot:scaffold2264_cov114-Isochrysis_galbana.AAC.10